MITAKALWNVSGSCSNKTGNGIRRPKNGLRSVFALGAERVETQGRKQRDRPGTRKRVQAGNQKARDLTVEEVKGTIRGITAKRGTEMAATGWQRAWVRGLTTALTACMMAVIFFFSGQNADRSDQTSGFISKAIIPIFYRDYESQTPEKKQEIYDEVQFIIRKCAHFSEYTLLGLLLRLCLESWFGHRMKNRHALMLPAFLAGTAYAGTDEGHQRLIEGRSGQWTDVLLDGCGVLFGAFLGTRLIITIDRKQKGAG